MHQASLGSQPPELDEPDEDELLDDAPELDELLLPELPELPGGGVELSGELPPSNWLPRHSPVSVTKHTLATKVDVCGKFREKKCGDGLAATRCVCDFTLPLGEGIMLLQIDVDVAEAPL